VTVGAHTVVFKAYDVLLITDSWTRDEVCDHGQYNMGKKLDFVDSLIALRRPERTIEYEPNVASDF
jgi:hypothetical protein